MPPETSADQFLKKIARKMAVFIFRQSWRKEAVSISISTSIFISPIRWSLDVYMYVFACTYQVYYTSSSWIIQICTRAPHSPSHSPWVPASGRKYVYLVIYFLLIIRALFLFFTTMCNVLVSMLVSDIYSRTEARHCVKCCEEGNA